MEKMIEIVLSCLHALGLAQYSGDPRIEWHLNAFPTKETVMDAVKNLPYKGGNTLTGTLTLILCLSFGEEPPTPNQKFF